MSLVWVRKERCKTEDSFLAGSWTRIFKEIWQHKLMVKVPLGIVACIYSYVGLVCVSPSFSFKLTEPSHLHDGVSNMTDDHISQASLACLMMSDDAK